MKTISIFPKKILNNLFRYEDLSKDEQTELAKVLKKLVAAGDKPFKKHRSEYKNDESW